MTKTKTSKFLSLILRHKPEIAGIQLDAHGWADVETLIRAVSKTHPLDRTQLEEIVRTDEKQRYSFSADGNRIRANQGHSIAVDVELERCDPPCILYHGTGAKNLDAIYKQGLLPMGRLYVHLSAEYRTAVTVGARHGSPRVYQIDAGTMHRDGFEFLLSRNGVWLTDRVPPDYLHLMPVEHAVPARR